ncbi:MAG: hypothetical protein ACRD0M_05585 [Acidimicrobiales bacterium]
MALSLNVTCAWRRANFSARHLLELVVGRPDAHRTESLGRGTPHQPAQLRSASSTPTSGDDRASDGAPAQPTSS